MKQKNKRKKRLKLPFYILLEIIIFIILIKIYPKALISPRKNINLSKINEEYSIDLKDKSLSIVVTGDIMCHNTQYYEANTGNGYDFSYVFDNVKDYISSADLAIGNLETTFAGSKIGYSSYPTFNTPEHLATDLKELGIDLVSTANNHCIDKGYNGLVKTIEELDNVGIMHSGTYASEEKSNEILNFYINDIKIAFLSYTYGTNGIPIPKGKEYSVNLINDEKIISDLEKAKGLNPDLIIVNMHWGIEYQNSSNAEQQRLAKLLFENGVDLILGSHPHVLQEMGKTEFLTKENVEKEGFVIYSLGNFISGQTKEKTKQTILLKLNISKNGKSGKIKIDNYEYKPLYFTRSPKYKFIDIDKEILNYENGKSNISKDFYNELKNKSETIKNTLIK